MKMTSMKLILLVLFYSSLPVVITSNKDEKLPPGTLQEEIEEKINNIPVDPGGNEQAGHVVKPEDVIVQTDSKESEKQTDEKEQIKQEKDESLKKEQIEPMKLEAEVIGKQGEEKIVSIQETGDSTLDPLKSENVDVKDDQTENLDGVSNNITAEIQPQKPVGDKSQKSENEAVIDTNRETQPNTLDETKQEKTVEEIQTFTEWTQKVLEEEKQKTASETPGSSVSKSKRSTNYASKECGAKVLASNPEAENIKAVLTSNKDEYMINPCKAAKKWFVVELCEPIHVSHFEVASFELFSSQPKTFRVSLSDRYPTKEWTNIGEFVAIEERNSQTFNVKEGYVVQFVRVEMIDHYGTEHYCPLTWFRLFGVPVEYDEYGQRPPEDGDDNENMDDALLRNGENAETDTPKNLFASATDTVMKLVKKVLNVEDKTQETEKNGTDIVDDNIPLKSPNDTNLTADGTMLPCVPKETEKDKKVFDEPRPPNGQSGFVTSNSGSGETKTEKDVSIVTKLEDHEQVPSVSDNLVTLIQSGEDDIASCDLTSDKLSTLSYFKRPICVYLELINYSDKLQMCSINDSDSKMQDTDKNKNDVAEDNIKVVEEKPSTEIVLDQITSEISSQVSMKDMQLKQDKTDLTAGETTPSVSATIVPLPQESQMATTSVSSAEMDKTHDSLTTIEPSTSSSQMESTKIAASEKPKTEDITKKPTVVSSADVSETIQSSSGSEDVGYKSSAVTPSLSDVESSLQQKTTVDFILMKTDSSTPSQKGTEQTTDIQQQPQVPFVEEGSKVEPTSTIEASKVSSSSLQINASESEGPSTNVVEPVVVGDNIPPVQQNSRDLGLVRVPILPYQKRETAIMRLNNRIKALEMNVSLSSRFLEEMSQKFKKQTEDMIKQHVFNVTIGEITNLTKAIEKQSQIQKQKIDVLETKVQNLTEVVLRLAENLENLNRQVQDKEYKYIMTIVIVAVIALIVLRWKSTKVSPEIQQMGDVSNLTHVDRRNSFSGCDNDKIESMGPTIQKYDSESTLVSSKRYSSDIDPGGTNHNQIKKKKKKKHKMSDSSTSLPCEKKMTPHKTGINSAGLLFGTSSRELSPDENREMTKINRAESYGGIWSFFASDKQEQVKPKGPDKKDVPNSYATCKTNGCIPKKPPKSGRMCNPVQMSNGCACESKSESFNDVKNGHEVDDNNVSHNNTNTNNIVIVSPFKKRFSFVKGATSNSHKDPLLKGQTDRNGKNGHERASSMDLTPKSVSFREVNGYK